MHIRFSCPYTSSQNGKAERIIRIINNMLRTHLLRASLPPSFWHYALATSTYLLNILPSKTIKNYTPTDILYSRQPTYDHLRVFGCLCYPNLSFKAKHKLSPRSTPCVFLGYPEHHHGYICLPLNSSQPIISRHVTFQENIFPFQNLSKYKTEHYDVFDDTTTSPYLTYYQQQTASTPTATRMPTQTPTGPHNPSTSSTTAHIPSPHSSPSTPTQNKIPIQTIQHQPIPTPTPSPPQPILNPPSPPPLPLNQPNHPMQTQSRSGIVKQKIQFNLLTKPLSPLPKNIANAMNDQNWKDAMLTEFHALLKQQTWELVPRPHNANIIRCHWLFRHKFRSDGSLERYKARLVVNGKSQ